QAPVRVIPQDGDVEVAPVEGGAGLNDSPGPIDGHALAVILSEADGCTDPAIGVEGRVETSVGIEPGQEEVEVETVRRPPADDDPAGPVQGEARTAFVPRTDDGNYLAVTVEGRVERPVRLEAYHHHVVVTAIETRPGHNQPPKTVDDHTGAEVVGPADVDRHLPVAVERRVQ